MSGQAASFSLSASSLTASSSTLVPQSAATGPNEADSNPSPLRPCYYLERPDGTRTALIEVDRLPELIRIRGLPTKLSAADTAGMMSVGIKAWGKKKYTVEIADNFGNIDHGEPNKHTEPEKSSVTTTNATTSGSSKAPSNPVIEFTPEDSSNAVHTSSPPSASCDHPEQEIAIARQNLRKGEKIYCTYWLSRGECHFTQQGCRFKHEMPDLETLEIIMGRRSYPKWWLESQGSIPAPPPHLRPATMYKGKRRAILPKPIALLALPPPPPTNMHTDSNNSDPTTPTPNTVSRAPPPTERLSNMIKSPLTTTTTTSGNKFAARKDGTANVRSHAFGASGGGGGNVHTPVSRPNGSNVVHSSISGPSAAGNTQSSNGGPSGSSNVRSPTSDDPRNNNVTYRKQPVSGDIRSPDSYNTSGGSSSSNTMIQTKQFVNTDRRSPMISDATSNKRSNNSLTATTPPSPQGASSSTPLHIKIPEKYALPFRDGGSGGGGGVIPTMSSSLSSSASPMNKPRVNLPLQNTLLSTLGDSRHAKPSISSAFGNRNANGKGEKKEAGMEGRPDGGIIASTTAAPGGGGSGSNDKQTTRPFDVVFDLLGPF